ncbi:Hypothetical predicted protein, partial [Paramuricea clavata]
MLVRGQARCSATNLTNLAGILSTPVEQSERNARIHLKTFSWTPNEIFARHKLATRKQQVGETLDEYLQELKLLSKDCNFCQVSAAQHRDEAVRDAFISGLRYGNIPQHLLENKTLGLQTAFEEARALDTAQKASETQYNSQLLPHQNPRFGEEQNKVGEAMGE